MSHKNLTDTNAISCLVAETVRNLTAKCQKYHLFIIDGASFFLPIHQNHTNVSLQTTIYLMGDYLRAKLQTDTD